MITARATADVKAKIAKRRAEQGKPRLSLRDRDPRNRPGL